MIVNYISALLDWCKVKIFLREKGRNVIFGERELWWCRVGMNIGAEIFGKGRQFTRPVLIFKKLSKDSFLGIPLTSQPKAGSWYVRVPCAGIDASLTLSQIRIFDARRLMARIEKVTEADFLVVKRAFLGLYG
jgi:mRNA interferase MazF